MEKVEDVRSRVQKIERQNSQEVPVKLSRNKENIPANSFADSIHSHHSEHFAELAYLIDTNANMSLENYKLEQIFSLTSSLLLQVGSMLGRVNADKTDGGGPQNIK